MIEKLHNHFNFSWSIVKEKRTIKTVIITFKYIFLRIYVIFVLFQPHLMATEKMQVSIKEF